LSKALVIVESPAKAKTINKYLGRDYDVEASLGHVKDLPKSKIGVDLDNDFEAEYIVIPGKEKVLTNLKKKAKGASAIYLAPDPDREGEAIAAHLYEELGEAKPKKKRGGGIPIHRVTFNEITSKAVKAAFDHPREIDWNLVDAQQTRRVLDRIVGYQISPLLWDKVRRGLSAGRVQTVALRLIVERERDIKAFEKKEYWTIDAHLTKPPSFDARFVGIDGEKTEVSNGEESERITNALRKAQWSVRSVDKKERRRSAAAPFTTSKFQQDASRKLRFSVKRAMMLAQRLYEGVELGDEGSVGLITYMRTDSTRVAQDALDEVRELIASNFGKDFLPESPNIYKSKKDAQEAHEAIRPTSALRNPDSIKQYLHEDEFKVYKLIWQRFVASQMMPAVFDQTTVDIDAVADRTYNFRVTGSVPKFEGFLKVYEESKEGKDEDDEALKHKLPPLEIGQRLTLKDPEKDLKPEQHFTEPPPRYNEASLVKELEERGIGRPSTYAAILGTIQERQYVQKIGGKFIPTEIGLVVTDLLVKNFAEIFDPAYTARLEEELDEIEEGKQKWTDSMSEFYKHFQKDLKYAQKHMENVKRMEKPTDEKCERCGSPLVLKWGKFGSFFACSAYDKDDPNSCTFTKENVIDLPDLENADLQETTQEEYCENCGRTMVLKRGRFGQFMACTGYPECKTTRRLDQGKKVPDVPLEEICPKCGRNMVLRHGRYGEFVSCSGYPDCKYVKQNFIGVSCPLCAAEGRKDGELVEKKARRRGNIFYGCSNYPKCEFTSAYKPVAEQCPECGSPYLLEKNLKAGTFLVCPNNKRTAAEEEEPQPKRKKKPGKAKAEAAEETASAPVVKCDFSKQIATKEPVAVA